MPTPEEPTPSVVQRFLARWNTLESYVLQEQALKLLFTEFCPSNSMVEHVLLKVSALNDFYSTNIFNKYAVAKHISGLAFDSRLLASDLSLVNDIALVTIAGKPRNFYSFASKYCSHHKPPAYPIYDQYVEKMLLHFCKRDRFHVFSRRDLKSYATFVEVILAFRDYYNLQAFTLRQVDVYLWLGGKQAFPPVYAAA